MSLNRIFSLIKLEVAEMENRLWWIILITFACCGIFSFSDMFIIFYMGIIVVLLNNLHHRLSSSQTIMPYLMIPASTAEKVIANGIIVYIIYNILIIALGLMGIYIGGLVKSHLFQVPFYWEWPIGISEILWCNVFLSAMFFSSIYFRNNGIVKGCLILVGFVLLLNVIDWAILSGILSRSIYEGNISFFGSWEPSILNHKWVIPILGVLAFLFFNFMSWLRLRETEV